MANKYKSKEKHLDGFIIQVFFHLRIADIKGDVSYTDIDGAHHSLICFLEKQNFCFASFGISSDSVKVL